MEIKVLNESYNPVMKRKEIRVEVTHTSAGTPERFSTRKALAEWFNAKLDNLYITDMITGTGTQRTVCNVELYDEQNIAARIVPPHIRARNLPAEERKKLKEEKVEKKEVKPPAEKPEKPEKAEKKPEKLEKPEKKEEKPVEKKVEEKPAEKKPEKKEARKEAKKEEPKSAKAK